jgi:hypothetical protein
MPFSKKCSYLRRRSVDRVSELSLRRSVVIFVDDHINGLVFQSPAIPAIPAIPAMTAMTAMTGREEEELERWERLVLVEEETEQLVWSRLEVHHHHRLEELKSEEHLVVDHSTVFGVCCFEQRGVPEPRGVPGRREFPGSIPPRYGDRSHGHTHPYTHRPSCRNHVHLPESHHHGSCPFAGFCFCFCLASPFAWPISRRCTFSSTILCAIHSISVYP